MSMHEAPTVVTAGVAESETGAALLVETRLQDGVPDVEETNAFGCALEGFGHGKVGIGAGVAVFAGKGEKFCFGGVLEVDHGVGEILKLGKLETDLAIPFKNGIELSAAYCGSSHQSKGVLEGCGRR